MYKKNYIVFEGVNYSGKSTYIQHLYKHLPKAKFIKEPSDPDIKQIALHPLTYPFVRYHLMLADRYQLHKDIFENENPDRLIISDRSVMSSMVYDGCYNEMGMDVVYAENLGCYYIPSIVFVLDTPVDIHIQRATKRNKNVF